MVRKSKLYQPWVRLRLPQTPSAKGQVPWNPTPPWAGAAKPHPPKAELFEEWTSGEVIWHKNKTHGKGESLIHFVPDTPTAKCRQTMGREEADRRGYPQLSYGRVEFPWHLGFDKFIVLRLRNGRVNAWRVWLDWGL